jgi:hypothetical protein
MFIPRVCPQYLRAKRCQTRDRTFNLEPQPCIGANLLQLSTFNSECALKSYRCETRAIIIQSLIVTSARHSQNVCPQWHVGDTRRADDSATDSSKLGGASTPFNQPRRTRLQTPAVFSYHMSRCQTARLCQISELRVALNGLTQTQPFALAPDEKSDSGTSLSL